jgi:hypothetical protein
MPVEQRGESNPDATCEVELSSPRPHTSPGYAFIFAINALLNSGTDLQNIKEELLLNQLKQSHLGSTVDFLRLSFFLLHR